MVLIKSAGGQKGSPFGQAQDTGRIVQYLMCETKFECQVTQEIIEISDLSPAFYFKQTQWEKKNQSFLCKHSSAQKSFSVIFNSLSKAI